jgi:hypothetical protein
LVEYTEYLSSDNFEGTGAVEGNKSYWTASGTRVNYLGGDEFEIQAFAGPIRAKRL